MSGPHYGNISTPGVGSYSSTTSYSYSSTGGQPVQKVSTTNYSYSDPFAKPPSSGFNFGTAPYSASTTSYGLSNQTNSGGHSAGGYGVPGGFGTSGSYSSPGGYGLPTASNASTHHPSTTNYSYSTTSNQTPNPSTVPSFGLATGALGLGGGYGTSSNYGTSTNYGGSYGSNYGTSGGSNTASNKPPTNSWSTTQPSAPTTGPTTTQYSTGQLSDLSKEGKQLFSNAFSQSSTKSAYQDLLKQLKASGQKYKDLDFPAELRSLTGGLSEYELAASGNPLNWRSLIWERPDEFYGKGTYQIFQDKIEPNDINQGSLGDCYFLSTLASIAETPDRIRKLFETDVPNEQGCYGVKVCDVGEWQTIIMDDLFPCSGKSRQPCFTKGNGNELWVLLLEKAWAKVYGSYARIEAGLTRECLHDLTGAPTKYYLTGDPSKFEEIWKALAHGESKNYAMTCGAGDLMDGADLMSSVGLVGSHAYSLLSAIEVKDKYGKNVRLVKLRNPWGKGEWKGDWSDESPTWTNELKRQVQLEDRDDGIFFMSYDDMLKYFSDIQICKVHDDYKYKSLKASCDSRHAVFFKMTVRTSGHYFITINQESKRKHPEKEDYQYSEVSVVMGRKAGNGYEYVEGQQKADKEVWTDGHLHAGEYIVYAKIAWKNRQPKSFSISAYGMGEVDLEQVPKTYSGDFIEKVYLNKGKQAKKTEDYKHCGVPNCYRVVELTDDGFGYVYYRNESGKTLEEELYFKFLEGLKFKKPYRGNSFKMVVPPGQERIVITKVIPDAARIRQAFTEKARFV